MAVAIDIPYLSSYLDFSDTSLNTLLSDPTTELVNSLLEQVTLKAREHEKLKSEKIRLDVELESALHTADSKTRVLKASVERGLKEAAEMREKLQAEETSKTELQSQLQSLQNSSSTSGSETTRLEAHIASLERSNRDTVSLLESRTAAHDELASELSVKHEKTVELRREVSALEQRVQSANSAASSARSKEQTMQQEIDSLRRTNEWLDKELTTRTDEHKSFRKEKNAVLSELQRTNEESITTIETLQRKEQTLRTRLEAVSQKADEFLTQANDLRDEANRQEETFRAELDTANRLAELMKESWNTEKRRQQDLSEQLEQVKDDASEELGRIQAEIETEHQDREAAERRVSELEALVERMEQDAAQVQATLTQREPQTPRMGGSRRGTPGPGETPSRIMSPGSALKGSLSYTQLVTDYHNAKAQLKSEKDRSNRLSAAMDEMIKEMEDKQPEILQLQADHARLESDIVAMSNLADRVGKERDDAKRNAKKFERQVQGATREGDILRQQLRDLSSQIKVLMVEFYSQSQGLEAFTPDERSRLEALARGDLDSEQAEDVTDTDRFISERLVTFRSIAELQEQNTKLLRLTRELGERMEGEEAQAQRSQATHNLEELEDLRQKYERCKDEISSLVTQSKSYMQERDTFRRMLSHRGQIPQNADLASLFGQSVNSQPPATPSRNGFANSIEQSPGAKEMADYAKLLKEMQTHFDQYRQESATDRTLLKDQLTDLTKKNGDLRNEISKKTGEVTLISERYEMLQGNFNMLKGENSELQKRSQTLSEKARVQDLRAQEVAENLVETRGLIESMRSEAANLKAEKEFWKSVETRLVDDNKSLLADRDRLNGLNANLQNLLNEREHSDAESKRRLQIQVENTDSELQATKRKLTEEIDEHKRYVMRKDHDLSHAQSRIDDLMTSLSSIREEAAVAKTTRDHLQSKVDEMTIELRSAEERLEVLQRKPEAEDTAAQGATDAAETSVSREQELEIEVSGLKRDLDLTKGELESAKAQVEQYKEISQASEDELRSFTETQEQYQQEMDKVVEEKDARIRSLEQNCDTLREEISSLNSELSTLRTESAQYNHKVEDQKTEYEAKLAEIKDQCERAEIAAKYHQEDLKTQAEIAQQAQQNYESELFKHAEAAKNVQKVRSEYNELKLELIESKTAAETARAQLSQGEETWTEAKERYERELADIRIRRDDISSQNKLLHQQLEGMNKQIADLQTSRASVGEGDNEDTMASIQADTSNLQELLRYVRREKEIVDVQLDLSTQETKRLRQQLEHTQSQLEDTRLKLVQQRRAEENSEREALNHKKLMETIEELNLNRESNSTLRLEKTQVQATLNQKLTFIDELQEKIQPLNAKVTELEASTESLEQELRLAQEARARFEQRYLDILHKSDSIDPADYEKVKEQVTALELERDNLLQAQQGLQAQVDALPEQMKEKDETIARNSETRQKIVDQAKARDRKKSEMIKEKEEAIEALKLEKDELQGRLQQLQEELEQTKTEKSSALENAEKTAAALGEAQAQVESLTQAQASAPANSQQRLQSEEGEVDETAQHPTDQAANNTSAAEVADLTEKLSASEAKASAAEARIGELESDIASAKDALQTAETNVASLQAAQTEPQADPTPKPTDAVDDDSQTVESLRQELAQAIQEMEEYRAKALTNQGAANIQVEDGSPPVIEQIASQVAAIKDELTARHEERVKQAVERFNSRASNMKTQLTQRLSEARTAHNQRLEAVIAETSDKLKGEHAQEIEALNVRHKSELDELRNLAEASKAQQEEAQVKTENTAENVTQTVELINTLTESEIRDVLTKNQFARKLVSNSLNNNVSKKEQEHARILEEKLAEAEQKANVAKQQAVDMEGKKYSVKMNMAENRAKAALAKIKVVEDAAQSTPEKAVKDVWAEAKDAKPAPAATTTPAKPTPAIPAPTTSNGPAASPAPVATPATTSSGNNAATTPSAPTPSTAAPATSSIATPSLAAPGSVSSAKPVNPFADAGRAVSNPFAGHTAGSASGSFGQPSGIKPPATATNSFSQSAHAPTSASGAQARPKLPNQPLGAGNNGPAGQRRMSQSSLPMPGGRGGSGIPQPGAGRGGQNQGRGGRGGAAGRGRGGIAQVNTSAAQNAQSQAAGSPKTKMNANAQQFVPKKRSADDSGLEASSYAAGDPKRPKGSEG